MTVFAKMTALAVVALSLACAQAWAATPVAAVAAQDDAPNPPHASPTASAPGARGTVPFNPAVTLADRVLTEDTVWRGDVLVEGVLAVAPQATLRIEAGTTVRFRRSSKSAGLLLVQGRLVAAGTAEAPVLFSSTSASPQPGEWQGVLLLGTEKKNLMENCRIEGANIAVEALYASVVLKGVVLQRATSGARFQDALVTMEGGGVSDCEGGLTLRESETELFRVAVTGNGQGVLAAGGSLYLAEGNLSGNREAALNAQGTRLKIVGGSVTDNTSGVLLTGCEGSLSGMKLSGNREAALTLTRSRMRVTGNEISGNGTGVQVEDGAAAAWGNAVFQNSRFDLYNGGGEEFRAPGNWWGGVPPKVFDNSGRGPVLINPVLATPPQP